MSIKAVFFDFGGVLVRTEYQAPRQHLAEKLGMDYEDLVRMVFDSPTAKQATVGEITAAEHWTGIIRRLKQPESELQSIRDEFFSGDVVDRELLNFVRSLRPRYKIGLISNAFDDLRPFIVKEKFEDVFDHMIISAEVGAAKPSAKIFKIALERFGVGSNEAIFVDDFRENIEGCEKEGIKGLHFTSPESVLQQLNTLL